MQIEQMTKKRLIAWLTVAYTALLTTLYLVKLSVPSSEVPGRDFDLYDIVANALGAAIAGVLLIIPKINNLIPR